MSNYKSKEGVSIEFSVDKQKTTSPICHIRLFGETLAYIRGVDKVDALTKAIKESKLYLSDIQDWINDLAIEFRNEEL